jgi:hypothetical protein
VNTAENVGYLKKKTDLTTGRKNIHRNKSQGKKQ